MMTVDVMEADNIVKRINGNSKKSKKVKLSVISEYLNNMDEVRE